MGKNRILKTPTYLSVFVCCFISGAFAQAATFTVNSPFDAADANPGDAMCETAPGNGICTLRAAIEEANTLGAGNDTIILPPNTYLLTLANELTITGDLTITGGEASTTIIDGNKSLRFNKGLLTISVGTTVNLTGMTISNSAFCGINNSGTLTLVNSTVSGNTGGKGGGINNSGTLTLVNSTASGNRGLTDGGGIFNSGTMILTNSTVSGNDSSGHMSASGGGIFNSGTMTLINSTVSRNGALGQAVASTLVAH